MYIFALSECGHTRARAAVTYLYISAKIIAVGSELFWPFELKGFDFHLFDRYTVIINTRKD